METLKKLLLATNGRDSNEIRKVFENLSPIQAGKIVMLFNSPSMKAPVANKENLYRFLMSASTIR